MFIPAGLWAFSTDLSHLQAISEDFQGLSAIGDPCQTFSLVKSVFAVSHADARAGLTYLKFFVFAKSSFSVREVPSLQCWFFYSIRKTKGKVVENSALCFSQLPLTVWGKQLSRTVSSRGSWLRMDGIIMGVFSLKARRTGFLSISAPRPCFPWRKRTQDPSKSIKHCMDLSARWERDSLATVRPKARNESQKVSWADNK